MSITIPNQPGGLGSIFSNPNNAILNPDMKIEFPAPNPPEPTPTPEELIKPEQPTKIELPPNKEEHRKCTDCSTLFPKNALYFAINSVGNCSTRCHECIYKAKVAKGATPIHPAKNGVDQKEWHAQIKSMKASEPKPPKDPALSAKGQPWLTAASKRSAAASTQSPPQSPPSQPVQQQPPTTAASSAPLKKVKEFMLEPHITRDNQGYMTLTINDYFKMGRTRTIIEPDPHRPQQSIRQQLAPQPQYAPAQPQVVEETETEEEEEDYFDPRHELLKDVVTYPTTAKKLGLDLEGVQRMTDQDCEYWYGTFRAINTTVSAGSIAHAGLCLFTQVAEQMVTDVKVNDDFHADLRGLTDDIREDENIQSALNELMRENEDTVEEYLAPEYKLGILLLGKAHGRMMFNNQKRIDRINKSNYVNSGNYGANSTSYLYKQTTPGQPTSSSR